MTAKAESGTKLWQAIAAPVVWAGHFLFSYVVAAIHCEKAGRDATLGSTVTLIGVATAVALLMIGAIAMSIWRSAPGSLTNDDFDFEHASAEERHRFLSHIAMMLCVLSAIAIIYVAIPLTQLPGCR